MDQEYTTTFSMFKIDEIWLIELANSLTKLKMFPYFVISHAILVCSSLKEDISTGDAYFSRRHPAACWFSSMLSIFAGNILANFLLGDAPLSPFKRHDDLLISSVVWYLVFYSPFDISFKLSKFYPLKLGLSIAKEIYRSKKVYEGVTIAYKVYPYSFVIPVIIGTTKGVGGYVMRNFERLLRGVWSPTTNEILYPSGSTKCCVIAAVVFTAQKASFISLPLPLVYLGITGFLIIYRLLVLMLGVEDPFKPFENLFCAVFMGGIWDAFGKALSKNSEKLSESSNINTNTQSLTNLKSERDKKKD